MKWRFKYRYLSIVLFPLSAVALGLFFIYEARPGPLNFVFTSNYHTDSIIIEIATARYFYISAFFSLTLFCILSIFVGLYQIVSRTRGKERAVLLTLVFLSSVIFIFTFHGSLIIESFSKLENSVGSLNMFRSIGTEALDQGFRHFYFSRDGITISYFYKDLPSMAQWLRAHVEFGNFLPLLSQCSLTGALCTVLAAPDTRNILSKEEINIAVNDLIEQTRVLNRILYTSTIALVLGVITIHMWMRFLPILLEDKSAELFEQFSLSVLTLYAVCYSSILFAIYLPTAIILQMRAKALSKPIIFAFGPIDATAWLENKGFVFDLKSHIGQIFAIIGPFLAGPLPAILQQTLSQ